MSDASNPYENESQQRILRLLRVLAGHEISGLSPKQVGEEMKTSPSMVTRDLANLKLAGLAEQITDSGLWRLSPDLVQISIAHAAALSKAKRRLDEVEQRFGAH